MDGWELNIRVIKLFHKRAWTKWEEKWGTCDFKVVTNKFGHKTLTQKESCIQMVFVHSTRQKTNMKRDFNCQVLCAWRCEMQCICWIISSPVVSIIRSEYITKVQPSMKKSLLHLAFMYYYIVIRVSILVVFVYIWFTWFGPPWQNNLGFLQFQLVSCAHSFSLQRAVDLE